jgi:hypothetical protein
VRGDLKKHRSGVHSPRSSETTLIQEKEHV